MGLAPEAIETLRGIFNRDIPEWAMIDNSKLMDFQSCPRKFFLRHVLGWDHEEQSIHLHFGKAWHKGLERLYTLGMSMEAAHEAALEFMRHYTLNTPDNDTKKTPEAAVAALLGYVHNYVGDITKYRVVAVETPYQIPISLEKDRVITVNRDLVVADRMTGETVIIEHKTASQLGKTFDAQWSLAPQIALYAYSGFLQEPDDSKRVPTVIVNATAFRAHNQYEFRRVPVVKSARSIKETLFTVNYLWDMIEYNIQLLESSSLGHHEVMSAFPQSPSACTSYSGCLFHDYCSAAVNPMAFAHPPIGMVERFWNPEEAYE